MNSAIKDGGELTELLGVWVNANHNSKCLHQVIIESDQQAVFWIETLAVAEPVNWGKVVMDVHQGSLGQSGFHATYAGKDSSTHLVANYKLGVLVIELFTSFTDGSSRPGTISREFFHRANGQNTVAQANELTEDSVAVDLTPFAGDWLNSCEEEQWLEHFKLFYDQGWQLQVSISQYHPKPVSVTSYVDNMGYLAFKADIILADRQLIIAANTQKELVVMTTFERFSPEVLAMGELYNRVYREIFYRQPKQSNSTEQGNDKNERRAVNARYG